MKTAKVNWKNVFNTNHKIWGWFADAVDAAKKAEYPYMLWNDKVYTTNDNEFKDTGYELVKGNFVNMSVDDDEILFV